MIVQTYFPQRLSPARYDAYLASGWFRGSVMLYKMDLLCVENDLFSVVNIRLNLDTYIHKKRMRKILRKNNEEFSFIIGSAKVDVDRDQLYQSHKDKFKGFIHNNLSDYLHAGFPRTVFDTKEVAVYHGDKLIAVSYFDNGENSIASLLGLYDQSYNSYSLGLYTMLLEIEFAKEQNKKWYYPGYVLDKKSSFNYKLQLGEYEYYNKNKRWSRYENFRTEDTLAYVLKREHLKLEEAFKSRKIDSESLLYPYFSMGYMNFWNVDFLKYPLVQKINGKTISMIAAYDIEDQNFKLLRVEAAKQYEQLINMDMSKEYIDNPNYLNTLLMDEELIEVSASANEISNRVCEILNSPVY